MLTSVQEELRHLYETAVEKAKAVETVGEKRKILAPFFGLEIPREDPPGTDRVVEVDDKGFINMESTYIIASSKAE